MQPNPPALHSRRCPGALAVCALLAAAMVAASAFAQDDVSPPVGPPIGNVRYRGTICEPGDTDDFTGRFVAGDRLSIVVTAERASRSAPPTLLPTLVLVDPDGLVRGAGAVPVRGAQGLVAKDYRIDKAGLWAVRLAGDADSKGAYTVAFRVKAAPAVTLDDQRLGGDTALTRVHDVAAPDGSTLDAVLVWSRRDSPVAFSALRDPSGRDVRAAKGDLAVLSAVTKRNRVELRKVPLAGGDGAYELQVCATAGVASYRLQLRVNPPRRPAGSRVLVLTDEEPSLDAVSDPVVSPAGSTVRLTGAHFSTKGRTTVLFGTAAAPSVTVAAGGTALDAVVPPRSGPAVTSVTVVNPDRQTVRRERHFAWIPAPSVADLVDEGTGLPVRASSTSGGRVVRLRGADLETGLTVRVGNVAVPTVALQSSSELRMTLPSGLPGDQPLTVSDPFGRTGAAPFELLYKTPPSFAADPFAPGAVPLWTARTVTIRGSGFEAADRLFVAGQAFDSVWVDAGTRTFDLPEVAGGSYAIRLVDSIGTIVDGPALCVKGPAVVTGVSVVGGDLLAGTTIPRPGGSQVQVDGTDFLPGDVVTLAGVQITSFATSTATRKVFRAPASAPGPADLTITDGAGQTTAVAGVVRYAGLSDVSEARLPQPATGDDVSALRGVAADLDGDGRRDDLVLVSKVTLPGGARSRQVRVLHGNDDGELRDVTVDVVPADAGTVAAADGFEATCAAVSDVDGENGADIVLGGRVAAATPDLPQLRFFLRGPEETYDFDATVTVPISWSLLQIEAWHGTQTGGRFYSMTDAVHQRGVPQAIVFGDLDGDGVDEMVVGTDASMAQAVHYDLTYLNDQVLPPTVSQLVPVNYTRYVQGTHLFENRLATNEGMVDVSETRLASSGTTETTGAPPAAFVCRDLALADVDGDGRLDCVLTWDEPRTVSASGYAAFAASGTASDSPRTATRVLRNDGNGGLTDDATSSWMPQAGTPEFWQADRLALADLDGDGDPDLVLLSRRGLDAWTGTQTHARTALRILRNDGTRFTDVTSAALPGVVTATADDFRGDALLVRDVDGDGVLDILVSTTDALATSSGSAVARLRVFFGSAGLRFTPRTAFEESLAVDTGEATDLLCVDELGASGEPLFLLLGEKRPTASPSARPWVRAQRWVR